MNRELRDEWTRRLRSGDHVQARGQLRAVLAGGVVAYCCLGVLCEVARERGVVTWDDDEDGYRSVARPGEGVYGGVLPPTVARWAGLGVAGTPEGVDPSAGPLTLSAWNDRGPVGLSRPATFARIADLIEEYL